MTTRVRNRNGKGNGNGRFEIGAGNRKREQNENGRRKAKGNEIDKMEIKTEMSTLPSRSFDKKKWLASIPRPFVIWRTGGLQQR